MNVCIRYKLLVLLLQKCLKCQKEERRKEEISVTNISILFAMSLILLILPLYDEYHLL